ncbi:MAG: hypothetical protein HUU38_30905 [Anaerolineales bacterium]|nr:hypothetical protein [Anaerolineales bacterium]
MPTPWNILVLTYDYLIEGQIDGSDIMQRTIFSLAGRGVDSRADVTLANVKIYPTGNLPIPSSAISSWTVGIPSGVLGVIPNDALSAKEAMSKRETAPAEMVLGPYLIRAQVYVTPKYKHREVATNGFSLKDAEITRLTPDSKLRGYKVPLMVVNSFWLQGLWFL